MAIRIPSVAFRKDAEEHENRQQRPFPNRQIFHFQSPKAKQLNIKLLSYAKSRNMISLKNITVLEP
jgi:hypothetical protein